MICAPLIRGLVLATSLLALSCAGPPNDVTPVANEVEVPRAAEAAEAPPLIDGVYVVRGICFGEGDCNRYWRASATVPLRERLDPASTVVATLAPDEWVEAVDGQLRFVPRRGLVHAATDTPPLAVGDVVYMLEPLGEGFYVLWHKGETPEHDWAADDPNEPITWGAAPQAPRGVVVGWWVQLRRENGQTGWVESPSTFECMGSLQGSANCRD